MSNCDLCGNHSQIHKSTIICVNVKKKKKRKLKLQALPNPSVEIHHYGSLEVRRLGEGSTGRRPWL